MSRFDSVPIPFQTRGNRRFLSEAQLAADPQLADFVDRFQDSFEHDVFLAVFWLVEPEQ